MSSNRSSESKSNFYHIKLFEESVLASRDSTAFSFEVLEIVKTEFQNRKIAGFLLIVIFIACFTFSPDIPLLFLFSKIS